MSGESLSEEQIDQIFNRVGIRSFEVFFKVVEHDGFSRAAERINLSQPTVSQHVKNLEDALGNPLIVREDSGVALTPLGQLCYDKMKSMTAAKDDLKEELKEYFGSGKRQLDLAASTIPGEFLLPSFLPDFLSSHPSVRVDLEIDDSRSILEKLDEGRVRWGVTGTREDNSSLEYTPLLVDEMILVGTEDVVTDERVLHYEDFKEVDYVGRGRQSGTQCAVEDQFREAGYDPDNHLQPRVTLGTVQAVREAVLKGVGVSFLPLCAVLEDLEAERLSRIPTAFSTIERTFYGVKNRFIGVPPVVEEFENFLLDRESSVESRL